MGFNIRSIHDNNSESTNKSNSPTVRSGFNVRSLQDQQFELKGNDDKTIGVISYGAKKAIESNTLDSYKPKDEEEKSVLEKYKSYIGYGQTDETVNSDQKSIPKDGFGTWLLKNANAGAAQFNKGFAATLDFILPTEFLGKYDIISQYNDYTTKKLAEDTQSAYLSSVSRGKGWKTAGDVVAGSVAALPNAILAMMSYGTSTATTSATLASQASTAASAGTVASSLKTVVSNMAKNPSYWSSVVQTLGTDYEEAKERGANDLVASATAIITSAINAGIEVGSGIEKLPSNLKPGQKGLKNSVFNWAKSSFEEGGEEVLQKITSNAMAKLMYDHDVPLYSHTDDKAVINPIGLAKDFGMGVAVGSVLGGVQTTAAGTINTVNITRTGRYFKKAGQDAVQTIIDTGLEAPKDSESYKLAEKAQKKNGKLSDYEVGKLYYANAERILQKKTVDVGDTFVDNNTGKTIKVVSRDKNTTTVEITLNGKTETKQLPITSADTLAVDDKYTKVETTDVETTTEETSADENATTTETQAVTVGDVYKNNKTGVTYTVANRDAENTTVYVKSDKGITTQKISNVLADDSFNNGSVYSKVQSENNNAIKSVYKALSAENLSSKTIDQIITTPEVKQAFEQITGLKLAGTKSEQRAMVRNWHNNAKKAPESGEQLVGNEVIPSAEKTVTEGEIAPVVNAMNETLKEGALEEIYASMPSYLEKSLDIYADVLRDFYKEKGSIGHIADYFTDGGAKVVSAIESTLPQSDLSNETVVESTKNTEDVLKNQPQSATIETKTTTTSVPNTDKSHTVAYTNDNQKIDCKFKVMSIDDVIASNDIDGKVNPKYPQNLQPRDRTRDASQIQITQIAANLNPSRLAESTSVLDGAPIIGPDNAVESGNGRTLAIKLAYAKGLADDYRNFIINNADKYGIDVSNLPANPILVRERLTEVDRVEFTRKANESSISSLSATEQAKVDAEKLTDKVLSLLVANDDGEINTKDNKSFIDAVIDKVFNNEDLNNVVAEKGRLSQRGKERIRNAIFYKAYGDASLSARLSESLDNDMKNATNVLLNIAQKVLVVKNGIESGDFYNFDFSSDITSAIKLLEKCREENTKVAEYAAQTTMFEKESNVVMEMAYVFETLNRGAKRATDFYNMLLDKVVDIGSPKQSALFDVSEDYTKETIFDETLERYNEEVVAENTAKRIEPTTKHTVTIPEIISRSESESRRDDDGRGKQQVSRGKSVGVTEAEATLGVQQDNGRSEETGVVTDEGRNRQSTESTEGKSEIREEDGNEERRNNLLPDNSRRGDTGSTGKQTRQIQGFERKNQGKNAIERRKFGRELIKRGQVEKVNDGTHEYTLVKPEAYNDDMKSMVEEAKRNGRELSFFIGNAIVTKENGDTFESDGIRFGGTNRIAVRYDGNKIPQKLAKHEIIHSKWFTPKVQKIANKIISSLTEADKQKISQQKRYQYYETIYEDEIANGEDNIVWEEFVCDVMAGMNDYTVNHIGDVNTFWYGNEDVESYDPASYTTSTDAGGNKYSVSSEENDIDVVINQSMTMEQAKDMIQRAFVLGGIKEWFDGEYKNGDEWLKGEGADAVALVVENEWQLQQKFLDKVQGVLNGDFYAEDIIEAYANGTLTGKVKQNVVKRLDTSKSTKAKDSRVFSPKEIKNAQEIYKVASERVTNSNRAKVYQARADIIMFAHNRGAAEALGLTQSELNKKLSTWAGYSARAKEASMKLNKDVALFNKWTGIENSNLLNRATVSQEELDNLVNEVTGDSNGWQRNYIMRTMLALDTHIDYSELNFEFVGTPKTTYGKSVNGLYDNSKRKITAKHNAPHTVAHEMGHFLDYQWARDFGITHSALTEGFGRDKQTDADVKQFLTNFDEFIEKIENSADLRSEYTMDRKEVFARFVSKFVQWVDIVANGKRSYPQEYLSYNDKFATAHFVEFVRLLQEKSMIDSKKFESNKTNGNRYSVAEEEIDTTKSNVKTKIKYSPTGIKLPAEEYAKFRQSTSTDYYKSYKTHKGLQYQSCVTDDSHILYIYEDGGFNKYKVVASIDYQYEDVAKAITEVLNNASHYKITDVINDILETLEVRRRGYTVYNAHTKRRSSTRGDDTLLERTSKTHTRGTDGSSSRVSGDKRGVGIERNADKSVSKKNTNRYSVAEESYAPTFYSQMGKVIDEMKMDKIAAKDVVRYLTDTKRGVKAEEIKWSGIEEFLEGKKSVTKAELQEFVAGSQLQIEEITLDNREIPYTQEQTEQIAEYESQRNEIFEELKREWKKAIGTDFPMRTFGGGLESSVWNLLTETDRQIKESADVGKEMAEAREQLQKMIAEDDFGYDSPNEAYHYASINPYDFLYSYDLTDEQRTTLERFASAKENYKNAKGIPIETQKHLKDIAAKSDEISRKISRIKSEHSKESEKHKSKWDEYTLDGGANYRELVFKIPDSDYSNYSMQAHWGNTVADAQGVLAHARIQDFDVDGQKMLFIEEIQSDWHNEGAKKGYIEKTDADVRAKRRELENYIKSRLGKENSAEEMAKIQEARREYLRLGENMKNADAIPDAPFRNNYHEYVLKRLIRMAAEEGYDSIGWTPAEIQSKRWSDDFAEGYRIEYDQDIPKFLNKYGKKWGAKAGKTSLSGTGSYTDYFEVEGSPTELYSTRVDAEQGIIDRYNQMNPEQQASKVDTMFIAGQFVVYDSVTANELGRFDRVNAPTRVWSMPITDSMKNSVLYEGQTRYSLATDGIPDLEDLWEFAKSKYGTVPKGEIPARDVDVPKKINEKDVVSLGARTMMEAGVTPDWAVSEFEKAILDGTMTHEVITNKKAGAWAKKQIESLGFAEALNSWNVYTRDGKVGKKELALGMELYNQCITNKDVHNAMKIAAELVAEATNAGQTLQAVRMLKRMTPDGQLYYIEKSIQKMNEEFKDKLGKKFKDIKLDDSLVEEFLTETDKEKRDEVYDKICQNIADQMPSTFKDKWNAWRYLAMLGNPRTHIRNIVGNAIFIPSIRLKNYIGAVIEKASKVDVAERTKSLHKSKEAVAFAKKDITDKEVMSGLKGVNAKYATTDDIESKRTIFDKRWQAWIEKLRTKNFEWLEKEDGWFLKHHYVDALARLITARKIDVNSIDAKTLETLRKYAIKEAQAATYRDANALADGLNAVQRRIERSDKKFIRASSALIEGVMPFKKTPMNIAKQGIYYSPVGILKGIYTATTKLKNGDATVTDVIDDISKGLSGTMLLMIGYFLSSLGLLVGADDKEKKEKEFDNMTGEQSYALKVFGKSYTIDWATPSNLALFVGSKLYDLTKDDFSFADVTSALLTVTEPLLELSVFSGLSGVIESAKYSDTNPIIAITSNAITSYLTQALPTIGGQVSRIVDGSKREYYYADKTSDVPAGLQRLIGQASSKIPFASYLFETSIDEWGREETYGNVVERAFENTVSPGYYSAENYTRVDKELRKLFEKTGDSAVLPVIQQKYYTEEYVKYDMTAEEYTKVKKLRGKKSFELVRDLISSSDYSTMTDKEKVKAIKKCYTEAGDYAKEQMIDKVKRKNK